MSDLHRVAFVVHEQELNLAHVADKELLESVGEQVAGLLVTAVTNLCISRGVRKRRHEE